METDGGASWLGPRYILKVKLTAFAKELGSGWERERSKDDLEDLARAVGDMELPVLQRGRLSEHVEKSASPESSLLYLLYLRGNVELERCISLNIKVNIPVA